MSFSNNLKTRNVFKDIATILVVISLFSSNSAFAQWIGPYNVPMVEAGANTIMFYKPSDITGFPNPSSCASNGVVVFDGATKLADRALSIGLTAQTTNRKVKYFLSGCLGGFIKAIVIRNE